jgi:hypothetical protein
MPAECPALSPVTLTRGSPETHQNLPIAAKQAPRPPRRPGTTPQETFAVIIAATVASNLSAAFQGREHVYTAGDAISWAPALEPKCATRAALVAIK